MPSIFDLYIRGREHDIKYGYVYSDDTIALIKLRISSNIGTTHSSFRLYYTFKNNEHNINNNNDPTWENSTLVSSLIPTPERFIFELQESKKLQKSKVTTDTHPNVLDTSYTPVAVDNGMLKSMDDLKENIRKIFREKKYDFHQVITIPSALFRIETPQTPQTPNGNTNNTNNTNTTCAKSTRNKSIHDMCKVSENIPCIIEWGSKLDPPKIYLYRDILNLEPNTNVICNWWKKKQKQQNHYKTWKYTVQLRDNSKKVFGNNQYSSILINRNSELFYEWSYSTPVASETIKAGIGEWIQKSATDSFNANGLNNNCDNTNTSTTFTGSTNLGELIMRDCTIKYEIFLGISDLCQLFDCCSDTLDAFFETPHEDKRFHLRYRPKYCVNTPTNCVIDVKFQKMNQNNSILILISTQQATWNSLQDVLEVLYYLFDHERLREIDPTEVSYKDLDPYLFKTNVKKGGYTRQCLNFNDKKLTELSKSKKFNKSGDDDEPVKRYKQPRILFTKEDFDLYNSLPDDNNKRYILYYRGNYYAAIEDYRHNKDIIEEYNKTAKKKESFLNTPVLFEIQQKYRDGTQEQLYYPGCVRAKSGLPSLKHQYILQKLIRSGEIQLFGRDAEQMIRKLESNEKLKRGDEIHYISKFPGRLTSDSYAYLPPFVKKMLLPFFDEKDSIELIRKGVLDGSFVHAIAETSDVNYRTKWTETKLSIVADVMEKIKKILTKQIFRWLYFGNIAKQMSYETFDSQFENFQHREHIYLCDLLSIFYDVNVFVIHLNSTGNLEKITRTTEHYIDRPSVVVLKFNKSYEIVMKRKRNNRKTTDNDCSQWDTGCSLITNLNQIFMNTNRLASCQQRATVEYQVDRETIVGQVIDIFNKCVGVVDCWGYFLPFAEPCPPFSFLVMLSGYIKRGLEDTLRHLQTSNVESYTHSQKFVEENDYIVAIKTSGGEIVPCNRTKIPPQYKEKGIQFLQSSDIPYKEFVSHYRLNVYQPRDPRIQMIADEKILKKTTTYVLFSIKQLLIKKSVPESAWKKIMSIKNIRKRQKNLYPLYMTLLNNCVFEHIDIETNNNFGELATGIPTTTTQSAQSCEDRYRFQFKKDFVIDSTILQKTVFHCFHYLIRNPSFGFENVDTNSTQLRLQPISLSDPISGNSNGSGGNDGTDSVIVFQSVEEAEDYIKNIQGVDDPTTTTTKNNPFEKNNRHIVFDEGAAVYQLYNYPLEYDSDPFSKISTNDYSKRYIKRRLFQIGKRLQHFNLTPFRKQILLMSVLFSRTIVVKKSSDDTTMGDKYNPCAGNPMTVFIKD